jgi:membrane protease YdiL (CAAX protease family)
MTETHCLVSSALDPQIRPLQIDQIYVLGRDAEAQIHLPSDRISHKHARLAWSEGCFVVEDLGSKNGVIVEGERTRRRALRDGDVISIGPFNLRYRVLRGDVEQVVAGARSGTLSGQFGEGELIGIGTLIEIKGLTGTLRIENGEARGALAVDKGVVVHAAAGALVGLEAARKLLSAHSGRFELEAQARVQKGELQTPMGDLLIEVMGKDRRATRRLDTPSDVSSDLGATRTRLAAARAELELASARAEFGNLFAAVLFVLFVYFIALQLVQRAPAYKSAVNSAVTFGFTAVLVHLMRSSRYPLRTFGMTLLGWRRSLVESVVATLPVLVVLLLARLAVRDAVSPDRPVFLMELDLRFFAYPVIVPLQEVMLRGAVQTTLQRFLIGRGATARAIVLTSMFFGLTHMHISLAMTAVTIVLGALWGVLYARHGTLLGATVSHLLIGMFGFALWGGVIPGVWD